MRVRRAIAKRRYDRRQTVDVMKQKHQRRLEGGGSESEVQNKPELRERGKRDGEADSTCPLIGTCEQSMKSSGGWSACVFYALL